MIIYLHGLNSSAASEKGRLTTAYCAKRKIPCIAPTLPHHPKQAKEYIQTLLKKKERAVLIGSSMGGFYSTWFCEQNPKLKAVLINPAVRLAQKLSDYVGRPQTNYHNGETYVFCQEHLQALQAMEVNEISHPQRYLLMVQTGDAVIDYREAVTYYQGAKHVVEEGGDHSFINFHHHLPAIEAFYEDTRTG